MAKRRRGKTNAMAPRQAKRRKAAAAAALAPVLPLPEELVDDVFLRLPPRSLAVCRCVCPSWNHLLSSPSFADRYHAAAAAATSPALRFVSVPVDRTRHRCYRVPAPTEMIPRRTTCGECPRVFCGAAKTCHGVFLLGRPCEGRFYVCNPSTGGLLRLPPRRPPWRLHSAGLGYDAGTGEHKAVLLELVRGLTRRWWIPRPQCVVATAGGRGQRRWRVPRGRRPSVVCGDALVSADVDPVFAGGRLHWMLLTPAANGTRPKNPNGILSFSVGGESFQRVQLPPLSAIVVPEDGEHHRSQTTWPPPDMTLGELDGGLCVVRDLSYCRTFLEVWKLHDYESGSWSMDYRIDKTRPGKGLHWPWSCVAHIFPLCYIGSKSSGESKKMLIANTMQMADIYDPDTRESRTVANSNCGIAEKMRMLLYQESPVHIAGMEYGTDDIKYDRI